RAPFFKSEVGRLELRVVHRFARGGQCERDGARDVAAVFRLQLTLPVEVPNLPGDAYGRAGHVEALDAAHAALAAHEPAPERLAPDAQRCHAPEPRDDDTARLPQILKHEMSCLRLTRGVPNFVWERTIGYHAPPRGQSL